MGGEMEGRIESGTLDIWNILCFQEVTKKLKAKFLVSC